MVLVDTSIWVDHLRRGNPRLEELLSSEIVTCHPFIVGELACGRLRNRERILALLQALPSARKAEDDEVLRFIDTHRLMGQGIGLVDVHILAAAQLSSLLLWTADKALQTVARRLRLAYHADAQ